MAKQGYHVTGKYRCQYAGKGGIATEKTVKLSEKVAAIDPREALLEAETRLRQNLDKVYGPGIGLSAASDICLTKVPLNECQAASQARKHYPARQYLVRGRYVVYDAHFQILAAEHPLDAVSDKVISADLAIREVKRHLEERLRKQFKVAARVIFVGDLLARPLRLRVRRRQAGEERQAKLF